MTPAPSAVLPDHASLELPPVLSEVQLPVVPAPSMSLSWHAAAGPVIRHHDAVPWMETGGLCMAELIDRAGNRFRIYVPLAAVGRLWWLVRNRTTGQTLRGHCQTIDGGRRQAADVALELAGRFKWDPDRVDEVLRRGRESAQIDHGECPKCRSPLVRELDRIGCPICDDVHPQVAIERGPPAPQPGLAVV